MSFIILALGSNSVRILLEKVTTALRNAKLAHLCYFFEIVSTNLFLNSIIVGARLQRILFFLYPQQKQAQVGSRYEYTVNRLQRILGVQKKLFLEFIFRLTKFKRVHQSFRIYVAHQQLMNKYCHHHFILCHLKNNEF